MLSIAFAWARSLSQFFLALAGGRFGNLAVGLGVNHQHRVFQLGVVAFQIRRDIVAIPRVIGHHEQDRLLPQLLRALRRPSAIRLRRDEYSRHTFPRTSRSAARRASPGSQVGQHRMLDHVLRNRFHQRIVGHRLHENRPVVVLRRRAHVDLQRQRRSLLLQPMVNVFDRL